MFLESLKLIVSFVLADRAAKDAEIASLKLQLSEALSNDKADAATIDTKTKEATIAAQELEAKNQELEAANIKLAALSESESVLAEFATALGYTTPTEV